MALEAGTRLGSYEVVAPIGAGGMGEVYRARDTRLERAVASLRHPHICVLHDMGRHEGIDFLVMEYLEGETLATRLEQGPLALDQALRVGIEIAGALDSAHRQGITHRDLKPGNIMLTKSGAKLLDFGLAKSKPVQGALASSSNLTTGPAVTADNTILGTLQYMAPEQLEGREADARSDIFAFGAVLYEMVTGSRAFEGKSQASLIAAILEHAPQPMSRLQVVTPPALDHAVEKCLAKDPEDRWQSARDLGHELAWIAPGGAQAAPTAADRTRTTRAWALLAAVIAVIAAVITGIAVWNLKPSLPPAPLPVSRLTIPLPPGQRLAESQQPALALSPDGTRLAYVASQEGKPPQLFLRAMDSPESRAVPGTEGAAGPFFSPDSQWVGIFTAGKLKKVSVSGGAALTLANGTNPRGASWGDRGTIVLAYPGTPLQQISEAGGTARLLTRFEKGEIGHCFAEFLPAGKAVLFAASATTLNWTSAQIAVQSLDTGARRNLIQGGMNPRYAPSGHLVYAQGGSLMAAPFDPDRLVLTGAGVPVVESVRQSIRDGCAQYSVSSTGTLVYVAGGIVETGRRLVWVRRNGAEQVVGAGAHAYRNPRISPDGRQVTVAIEEEQTQVWLCDLARETLTPLTFDGYNNLPAWTPDGKRIVFQSTRAGPVNLFWQLADGSGGIERLTTSDYLHSPSPWTPDGQVLAYTEVGQPTTGIDIWTLRLSDRKPEPFLRTSANEGAPQFSPDGRWLAYASLESGRHEVHVQPYPGPGGKRQISTEGGNEPCWNRNGRELFYRNGNRMMVAEVTLQPGFSAGKPRVLFEGAYVSSGRMFPNYDVTPDGQRFLMVKANEQDQAATQIHVILNWFEELKRRVPVEKK